jgi:putative MFS transporter
MLSKQNEVADLEKSRTNVKNPLNLLVIVAALGYFVDIYDLLLFGIVRMPSLKDLHVADTQAAGDLLFNSQMGGMLIGGIMWGMLGDKKGRLSVLFGSIILYSVANIANGFIMHLVGPDGDTSTALNAYAILRFIAGVGLAGELGAGITLVSETMSKEHRGYGTTIVASVGVFGAVVAGLVGGTVHWTNSYFIGGGMGLALLLLRIGVYESGMFRNLSHSTVRKGNFHDLFTSRDKLKRYLCVILIAVPVWFVMGRLILFSYEMGIALGMEKNPPVPGRAIMFAYIGITLGDVVSGAMSQYIKSRKKVIALFMVLSLLVVVGYFLFASRSLTVFYTIATMIGFVTGYWAVFMTTAAESFGTNLRATVSTTAPNFVRGAVIPVSWAINGLMAVTGVSLINSTIIIGIVVFALGFWAVANLKETFGKDLDYIEKQ